MQIRVFFNSSNKPLSLFILEAERTTRDRIIKLKKIRLKICYHRTWASHFSLVFAVVFV